jgi:scyllo-inositol 2-dehydrogenase (NADP+)
MQAVQARMGKAPIRIAAVGLGWVSQNRHLPAIAASRDLYELAGVIDPSPDRARVVAARYRTRAAAARGLADVPWLDDVDAVVIGAPPFAHSTLIAEALAAGKHVLTEKPFVMYVPDGERLCKEALKSRLVLAIVHNFQFSRSFKALQRLILDRRLGEIRSVWATQLSNPRRRLPEWYRDLPGGLFFDESPHLLYLVRRLLPDLALVEARITPSPAGESTPAEVYAQFSNHRGQTATLLMNFEAALSEWHLIVTGEHGTADVDVFRDILTVLPNDGRHDARDILRSSYRAIRGHLLGTLASGALHSLKRLNYGNREIMARFADAIDKATLQPDFIGSHEALAVRQLQGDILTAGMSRTGSVASTARAAVP